MQTLREVLHHDANALTKKQIVDLLQTVHKVITPAAYEQISGLNPTTELDKLRKAELVAIVEDIRGHYELSWESGLADLDGALRETFSAISELLGEASGDDDFRAADAEDADFPDELGSIDFAKLIGGPMDAAVRAQANASVSTVDFIQAVGFEGEGASRKIRMVDFSYERADNGDGSTPAERKVGLTVPFIAMLNVPALRIETLDIDLNVKLNSIATKQTSTTVKLDVGGGYKFGPVKFKVDVSARRTNSRGIRIEKEYAMNVKVQATNDEMPAGLAKILGLLAA